MEVIKRRHTQRKSARLGTGPSDHMSPEAQIAMQLALKDTIALKEELNKTKKDDGSKSSSRVIFSEDVNKNSKTIGVESNKPLPSLARETSFSELYERNGSARMHRDLTDESYSEESESKKALGGGKVESAMEIVEIVNRDNLNGTILDEEAMEELARINAVDKCAVWIEATNSHQSETTLTKIPETDYKLGLS